MVATDLLSSTPSVVSSPTVTHLRRYEVAKVAVAEATAAKEAALQDAAELRTELAARDARIAELEAVRVRGLLRSHPHWRSSRSPIRDPRTWPLPRHSHLPILKATLAKRLRSVMKLGQRHG